MVSLSDFRLRQFCLSFLNQLFLLYACEDKNDDLNNYVWELVDASDCDYSMLYEVGKHIDITCKQILNV